MIGPTVRLVLALLLVAGPAFAATHHRHAPRTARQAPARAADSTPDCRYPDGTPFDPDIIGGANHVGDGGPAVNLGGYPPCGY